MPEPISLHRSPDLETLYTQAIVLLKQLIAAPSFSGTENETAAAIETFLNTQEIKTHRTGNNIWAYNKFYDPFLPTILLNSHHDTVKPNAGYSLNPFEAIETDGKLFGLGSNDAGGALVALLMTFIYFYDIPHLKYNLCVAATAEEEISGKNGIELILNDLGKIDFAIVGEPTEMELAVAEKGLLVIDCIAKGTSSHAAHANPDNAIYNALTDIAWFKNYKFPKTSALLGDVKMSVTMIKSGTQHNVVPDSCEFTVDIRSTDVYSNTEILEIIKQHVSCGVIPRSLRLNSSSISPDHPFVIAALESGSKTYGSPTISDQALMNFTSVKIGPGKSQRSHSSDEYIFTHEIKNGIDLYIKMLSKILIHG